MTLTNYWWLLIWVFVGGIFLIYIMPQRREIVMGKSEYRWSVPAALILVLPYIIWAGFRSDIYGDTGSYREMFLNAPDTISGWASFMDGITKDKGFYFLSIVIKWLLNSDVAYFMIIAAFQIICVAVIYRKYSCNYWLSIFIFIASTDYLSWVHNGMRQFVAVTMIFVATGLLLKKKYISMILIILLASTMHGSALLMLPIIFIIQGKAWNKKTLLCILASMAALVFVDQFTNILDTLLADTQYTNVVSDWQMWQDDGTNPIRVLLYAVPTILSLIGLKWIRKEDNPVINMAVNASIISTGLYIISMGTSGIFMGRLPIYVSMYATGILLPWEIKNIFTKRSQMLVNIIAVVLYVIYYYYQMHFTWGLI